MFSFRYCEKKKRIHINFKGSAVCVCVCLELLTILLGACSPLVLHTPSNYNAEPLGGGLRCILLCFEAVFGLRVNLTKSGLVPIGDA